MNFFIKKIFEGKSKGDELVHLQFQKFSRGNFKNRAVIKVKKMKDNFSIGTTPEYANEFVLFLGKKLGDKQVNVTGAIVSTLDLTGEVKFKEKKQFQGVKRYLLDTEMTGNQIAGLVEKLPTAFIGLSFKGDDFDLKVKPKAPKSGKPSSKGDEKPNPDFCKLKTSDKDLAKGLMFDVDLNSFKEAIAEHEFVIEDIEVDYSIKNPKEMREKAVRKGKIIRILNVDGKTLKEEKEFEA